MKENWSADRKERFRFRFYNLISFYCNNIIKFSKCSGPRLIKAGPMLVRHGQCW